MVNKGDVVLCRVTKILPHSAFIKILDTGEEGYIHISQITSKRVKKIEDHLKIGQEVVCKIINTKGKIEASIRAVSDNEKKQKIKEIKETKKAEATINAIARKLKKTEQELEQIKNKITKNYGSLGAFSELIKVEGEKILEECEIPREWWSEIIKNFEPEKKTITLKKIITAYSIESDGIQRIKKTMKTNDKKFKIKYLSAPQYEITFKDENGDYNKAKKQLNQFVEEIINEGKKQKVIINIKQ